MFCKCTKEKNAKPTNQKCFENEGDKHTDWGLGWGNWGKLLDAAHDPNMRGVVCDSSYLKAKYLSLGGSYLKSLV